MIAIKAIDEHYRSQCRREEIAACLHWIDCWSFRRSKGRRLTNHLPTRGHSNAIKTTSGRRCHQIHRIVADSATGLEGGGRGEPVRWSVCAHAPGGAQRGVHVLDLRACCGSSGLMQVEGPRRQLEDDQTEAGRSPNGRIVATLLSRSIWLNISSHLLVHDNT